MMLVPPSSRAAGSQSARFARLVAIARLLRARARLISALVLLSFVLCHLVSHMFLIVSLPAAEQALDILMTFWWSETGTYVLPAAPAVHPHNALWGIYIVRNPGFIATVESNAHEGPEILTQRRYMAGIGLAMYLGLVLLPFAGRGVRSFIYRLHRPPQLTHAPSGRTMAMLPGATVLETLRANAIPHASVCG